MKNKIITIIIIVKKNMKTSLKLALPKFSLAAPIKWGAAVPLASPGPYASLNETKKDKLFSKRLRSSYLFGSEKNISLS